ncbi:stage iii sporulation protein spoab [Heliomicrobium modesticaldum Ice1]|uniref:Stage iii sporulation protein spoab n=1 Tax=Heliobacterium modesticaldum (strain ATCC 51547 / Ice1) TaxID=498761 RepID=B0TEH5_HELMI|nr:stage III sporulation protein AB [Heliomicrobium modesticaldum]ABZ82894.1 stage iii sporulation protein spoab [Heliomicrobium modesticaldum Ice1]
MGKLVGAALIVGAFSAGGFMTARDLRRRRQILASLQSALAMLATEVAFRATHLPEALVQVSRTAGPPVNALFAEAGNRLRRAEGQAASAIWLQSVGDWLPRTPLHPSDGEELARLALGLGAAPREDQLHRIEEVKNRLAYLEQEARERETRMAKVWSYGGVLLGAAVVLTIW